MLPPTKPSDIFSPEGGCSEGLDAFRFFLDTTSDGRAPKRMAPLGLSYLDTHGASQGVAYKLIGVVSDPLTPLL